MHADPSEADQPSVDMPRPELSPDDRRQIGRERAGQRVKAAMALMKQSESEAGQFASIAAEVKRIALAAMPRVMTNLVAIATGTGKHQKAPAIAQATASKLVAGAAGLALEVAPGGSGGIPLNELPLEALHSTLGAMLESVERLRSIEGQSHPIESVDETAPTSGAVSPEPTEPGAPGTGK